MKEERGGESRARPGPAVGKGKEERKVYYRQLAALIRTRGLGKEGKKDRGRERKER